MLYKTDKKIVKCELCNHFCVIHPNKTGLCRVRKNIGGKLYSLVYGKIVSASQDPIEKKPLYHFLPGTKSFSIATVGCNFSCKFCQNYDISQTKSIVGEDATPQEIVSLAIKTECKSIAYTYTEPTIFFEFAYDTAVLAKGKLKNIFVTNGYFTEKAFKKIRPFLDAANIDLKSMDEDFYKRIVGAKLEPVLENIKRLYKAGVWIELTTLLIPGYNDKCLKEIAEFIASIDKNIPWHISRYYPYYKLNAQPTPMELLEKAYKIGKDAGLNYVYLGNVPSHQNTYCPKCNSVVIERSGYEIVNHTKNGKCEKCGEKIAGVF